MRGKATVFRSTQCFARITPAYAGKSTRRTCRTPVTRDHPRLCGEKHLYGRNTDCRIGSPPPMRGKGPIQKKICKNRRITPAYAGKSGVYGGYLYIGGDHPRLCGEKRQILRQIHSVKGSPPPMRGKGLRQLSEMTSCWDHPRLCGEKVF